jgi:ATP-binding cassette, subfamily B, bacterial PglK
VSNTDSQSRARRALLGRLWAHLSVGRRRQFKFVIVLTVVSALAEIASLGAVIPFIGALTQPDRLMKLPIVADLVRAVGIVTTEQMLWWFTVGFVMTALIAGAVRMLLLWANVRITFAAGADLSSEVYRRTLYQPYSAHVARNSSEVISGITNKVGGTVVGVMFPFVTLISASVTLLATFTTLLIIDPWVALGAGLGFGACYSAITRFSRRRLLDNSRRMATEYTVVVKALQEGLGGIRDVLIDGTQPIYSDVYRRADKALRSAQGDNAFIAQSPRISMEAIGMVLIAGLAWSLSRQSHGVAGALPVLGALAIGAQRLLPALQQVYVSWAAMAGNHASLEDTVDLLDQPLPSDIALPRPAPLPFHREIRFDGVTFRYGLEGPWVIDHLNVTVAKGMRVGLVGATGSGKSTLLDLLMGLLQPTEGSITIDGNTLTGRAVRAWQGCLAHVPQSIYLADATLLENIAFGSPLEAINLERIYAAAERAQIRDFIDSMPEGFQSLVGERGVRLSGGQRQRIGIARALYKEASVLILDEATSALDNATERSVMDAIDGLSRDLTVFIIAHRLSTVRRCDVILELDHGKLVAQAPFDQLLKNSTSFQRMAAMEEINT